MSDIISKVKFHRHMEKLTAIPKGFTTEVAEDVLEWNAEKLIVFICKSETVEIRFRQTGEGTTNFLKDGKWFTFDRLGVEASFYHLPLWSGDKPKSLNAILKEQLKKVENQLELSKTSVQVPSIPFTVQPNKLKALKAQLNRSGYIRFMPSGFGTGYTISKRKAYSTDKRAPVELEKFFGIQPLYISTFDAD